MHTLCTATVSSLTYAIKGQKLLAKEGIESRLVKPNAKKARRGCAFGIEFPCQELRHARSILTAAHLPVNDYFNGGGGELL